MDRGKVLVVDDDTDLCQELAELLSGEGYSVDCASSYGEAETLIKNNAYGAVVIDFKMQGFNGIEMSRKIKAGYPEVKIYMMSGRPNIEQLVREEGVAGLINGIITKPFDYKLFIEKIKGP